MGKLESSYRQDARSYPPAASDPAHAPHCTCTPQVDLADLGKGLRTGDLVFIRIRLLPFRKVADTTLTWTNHVGIVTDVSGAEPMIAESRVPLSGQTGLRRFARRSEEGRIAVARLHGVLGHAERDRLAQAVRRRAGILYDTGFDLRSRRQFCSRFVREVIDEATGTRLGEVENFSELLKHNPDADQTFWKVWYLGAIPWQRETVTPASLLRDDRLQIWFDGYVR